MGFFGAAHGCSHLLHISYNDGTWHSYTLTKGDPKNKGYRDTPLQFCHISIIYRKSANFAISRNTDIDSIQVHNF